MYYICCIRFFNFLILLTIDSQNKKDTLEITYTTYCRFWKMSFLHPNLTYSPILSPPPVVSWYDSRTKVLFQTFVLSTYTHFIRNGYIRVCQPKIKISDLYAVFANNSCIIYLQTVWSILPFYTDSIYPMSSNKYSLSKVSYEFLLNCALTILFKIFLKKFFWLFKFFDFEVRQYRNQSKSNIPNHMNVFFW